MDRIHHPLKHGVEEASRVFGIAVCEQLHGALDIREEHRELLALAFERRLRREDFLCQVLRRVGFRGDKTGLRRARGMGARGAEFGRRGKLGAATRPDARELRGALLAEFRPDGIVVPALRTSQGWLVRQFERRHRRWLCRGIYRWRYGY